MTDESEISNHEIPANENQTGIPVRLGCGSIIIFTILCSVFLLSVVNLAVKGEIIIRRKDLEGYRVWLIRRDGISGIGFSSSTEMDLNGEPGVTCVETKARFFEWQSGQENGGTTYCECYQSHQGEWSFIGEC